MTRRRTLGIILLVLGICIAIITPVLALTPAGATLLGTVTDTPTLAPYTPTPPPPPKPILTPRGTPPNVTARSAILIDADTDRILMEKDAETPRQMASTTKIMTAVIAIQTGGDLNQVVTVGYDAWKEVHTDYGGGSTGSSADLQPGEKLTLKDLLYALMLPSGDDAAVAIADDLAGSSENFVQRMNLFAQRMHLYQTHFANPDGLPAPGGAPLPDHYSSALDLARLAHYAMSIPLFAKIVQTTTYSLPATADHRAHTWITTNWLLNKLPYNGATGIKTGTTGDAGACLVFSATRNGHHLIGVVLHSTLDAAEVMRFKDAKALLDWGFNLPLQPPTGVYPRI